MGRRKTLDGDRVMSFRATRRDQEHLQVLLVGAARHSVDVDKTSCIRDALGIAAATQESKQFDELRRLRAEADEARRRLDDAERERDQARRRAELMSKRARKKTSLLERLLIHLPDARRRAAQGLDFPSGNAGLDQLWLKSGKSWPRVVTRLEAVEAARLGDEAPPDPAPPDPGGAP